MQDLRTTVRRTIEANRHDLGFRIVENYAGQAKSDGQLAAVTPGCLVLPVKWQRGGRERAVCDLLVGTESAALLKAEAEADALALADNLAVWLCSNSIVSSGASEYRIDLDAGIECETLLADDRFALVMVRATWLPY
jgi:hypothetical protein